MVAVAIATLGGCGSSSDSSGPRTATVGQTLTVSADNEDIGPGENDKVHVEMTVVDITPVAGLVRITLVNTSKHSTTIPPSDFVSDDGSAWYGCTGFTQPGQPYIPVTGDLAPGQTVTVDAKFPGLVQKIHYSQGSFVTAGDGTVIQYASEIQDTWTVPG